MKRLSLVLLLSVSLFNCKHKTSFESLGEVSYTRDISPIINSNCAFSGCHGHVDHRRFDLTSYNGLMAAGIEPGAPEKSELYGALKSYNEEDRMPRKPYDRLSEKQVQLIYVWIGQGAKNN